MELFGGYGGVTRCSIRRRLRVGPNVDLTTGLDVQLPRVRQLLWQFNQVTHPKAWQLSMQTGAACSRLASQLAEEQLRTGRHFL
eukprot:1856286-Amphidinium_carterae.1